VELFDEIMTSTSLAWPDPILHQGKGSGIWP